MMRISMDCDNYRRMIRAVCEYYVYKHTGCDDIFRNVHVLHPTLPYPPHVATEQPQR